MYHTQLILKSFLTVDRYYIIAHSFIQDNMDGSLQSELYMKDAKLDSFRSYTVVAENGISLTTAQVQLKHSKSSL